MTSSEFCFLRLGEAWESEKKIDSYMNQYSCILLFWINSQILKIFVKFLYGVTNILKEQKGGKVYQVLTMEFPGVYLEWRQVFWAHLEFNNLIISFAPQSI